MLNTQAFEGHLHPFVQSVSKLCLNIFLRK